MCGIAGIHRLTNRPLPKLDELASELLYEIESRGKDATGYVAMDDEGRVALQKASCPATTFNLHRAPLFEDARTVLLHTRYATQGEASFPENNHPLESGGIYATHNGHIWNDREVFQMPGKGVRRGQVDSEAIPALVAARGWESLPDSLDVLEGAMAVALLNAAAPGQLVLARGYSSPLVVVQTRHLLVWASTSDAIRKAWERVLGTPPKRVRYLKEGEALLIDRGDVREAGFECYLPPPPPPRPVVPTWSNRYGPSPNSEVLREAILARHESRATVWDGDDWTDDDENSLGSYLLQCEDCQDWTTDIQECLTFGIRSHLCGECRDWAIQYEHGPVQKELTQGDGSVTL